ncbi:hypothetical protein MNBD_NITROSPINAE04-2375 [hydrothermal vent metagenome]|uniref:Uncharacterized protein n=1 Tax=hydrothermal vent metagenome TaxID=652676 RepID=A0A3B1BTY9_9ZZZZ
MKFISENEFLGLISRSGIGKTSDDRSLRYTDETGVLGFDFTNLAIPDMSKSPYEGVAEGDRSVEYAMVSTLFKLMEVLALFPVYLFASDNEWADEDLGRLVSQNYITADESSVLQNVIDQDRGMDVVVIGRDEVKEAVRLITPQITALSTECCAVDDKGRFLATFSQDDEVSFNTKDNALYNASKEFILKLKNLPFEIIQAEDYL